jgi:hypothetical protein
MAADGIRAPASCFHPLFIGGMSTRFYHEDHGGIGFVVVVSIPSSSGHVYGRRLHPKRRRDKWQVSIPSSSGHVYGLESGWLCLHGGEFQSLFIGACLGGKDYHIVTHDRYKFRSPLHRGMAAGGTCHRQALPKPVFPSPLHWGMSTRKNAERRTAAFYGFPSPLHRGMSTRKIAGGEIPTKDGRFPSPIHRGMSADSTISLTRNP